jgi:tetratricopeptide (TPR) repeat protein
MKTSTGADNLEHPVRFDQAEALRAAIETNQAVIAVGASGLGQLATSNFALANFDNWEPLYGDGCWLSGGYLSGVHELIVQSLEWAEDFAADLIANHEQTLKRLLPMWISRRYCVPKDLTNTASQDERTRFYHNEYQNKLLVGLAEFLMDVLHLQGRKIVLIIENAGKLSATSKSLISIIIRNERSRVFLKFVLFDCEGQVFYPDATVIRFPAYGEQEFYRCLGIEHIDLAYRKRIYTMSHGNLHVGRSLAVCYEHGVFAVANLDAEACIELFVASLDARAREAMTVSYIRSGFTGDLLARRCAEVTQSATADHENLLLHASFMRAFRRGEGPLNVAHAMAISNKYLRAETLAECCEILMGIGLYDTWFDFFSVLYLDPDLRAYGDGASPVNRLFINATFVLYAAGNAPLANLFLEEFLFNFPDSYLIPTALYAQSMIYGRYQVPADLVKAEECARRNIEVIDKKFRSHYKYLYIKVFAENAYAYVKARQGKFEEALALCERGGEEIKTVYGEASFRLHRSILVYNISQIYEIIGDLGKAEAKLREAITYDPYYAEYHNDMGNLLSRVPGREGEALEAYKNAIFLSPPYYEVYFNRGLLMSQLGDEEAAMNDFRRVLAIKPEEWRAMREIGNLKLIRGDAAGAQIAYAEALMYGASDADLHANFGLACAESGDDDAAIDHYTQAIRLNPRQAEAHNNLAAMLVIRKKYELALTHANAASAYGNDPDFVANRSVIQALCWCSAGRPNPT